MLYSLLKMAEAGMDLTSQDIPTQKVEQKKGKEGMEIIVFDCDKRQVYSISEKITDRTSEEWNFVGNSPANSPQDVITTDTLKYILGVDEKGEPVKPTKFSLKVVAERIQGEPAEALRAVLSWYNPSTLDLTKFNWKAALYSVRVILHGKEVDIAKTREYREHLLRRSTVGKSQVNTSVRCQICGGPGALDDPDYPAGSPLKVYIVDKLGFASGIADSPEARLRSHAICPRCRNRLLVISKRLEDFSVRINKLKAYVLILSQQPVKFTPSSSGWILEELEALYRGEKEVQIVSGGQAQITLLFGERQQSKFRLYRMIPDVPVFRLVEFTRTAGVVRSSRDSDPRGLGLTELSGKASLDLSFNSLYSVLPVEDMGNTPRYIPFLDAIQSILLEYPLDQDHLYAQFLSVLRCRRYDTCLNSMTGKFSLEDVAILQTSFIKLFRLLGIMSTPSQPVQTLEKGDIYDYVNRIGLNKGQAGLFLLGAVIAYIGREQYRKGDEKKAILDRIDYEGMDVGDILTLVNRVYESARDYKVLNRTQVLLSDANTYILEGRDQLTNPVENVFHILSGYSFQTKLFMTKQDNE
ncbi:TM1802 family CRISPR-associated protein [Metallosphaera javensis (ex Sakai et al. 2022)]|uniref:TM1802 family CRISPR-associated protein n=1 Tax=Metallosphaera javensis (ex Sakai et al. 2022) TaxID=2775498 RepID=UPI002590950F|nr:MAG: hypothetical protein MjAS7_1994 [Metallosphaera javensis (ex Sakai et al. 2022)]